MADAVRASLSALLSLGWPSSSAAVSLSSLLLALAVRVSLLLALALVLRLVFARLPWLPLPLALLSLAHWHAAVRALVGCAVYGGAGCGVSGLSLGAGALRLVDAAGASLLRLAHLLVLSHEYALPYAATFLCGALSLGGVSFWYAHALFLSVDVHAPKQSPRAVLWASDLLAWLELSSLLAALVAASASLPASLSFSSFSSLSSLSSLFSLDYSALLHALPLNLSAALAASPGVRAVHVEQLLVTFVLVAWYAPRVCVPRSRVLTWALRVVLVSTCALNVTLALSLGIAALRLWPLTSASVPTVGVYGLVR